jgi:hypothetical protein
MPCRMRRPAGCNKRASQRCGVGLAELLPSNQETGPHEARYRFGTILV